MIEIDGDLILEKDTEYSESIFVHGNIYGKDGQRYNLKVAGNINAWNINAKDINAMDINARDINAWNINAKDIDAWNINTGNINARDINAKDINAGDINAKDINAMDINAWDIHAGHINFYAICFAYQNIKCNSIKGRRENCKYFVLDGKVEIREKVENED